MLRAFLRTLRSDFRAHRLQSALIILIVAVATMTLTLAAYVNRSTAAPFERFFDETHGAHVWFATPDSGVDLGSIAVTDGVSEHTGPFPTTRRPIDGIERVGGPQNLGIEVVGLPVELPATGRPLITDGRWLRSANEVVLDPDIARFEAIGVGDQYTIAGRDGPVTLDVVGIAVHVAAWQVVTDGLSKGAVVYVTPEALARIEPDPLAWGSLLGVRLDDPAESRAFAGRAFDLFPQADITVNDWQDLRAVLTEDNEVNVVLLSVFSLFALLAAGFVIANAIGGRVLAQYREIGLLKAIGFTPRGVAALFVAENLALGFIAGIVGLAAGIGLAPLFEEDFALLLTTVPPSPYEPGLLLALLIGVELAVALFTLLPAWRGGRIGTVQAITIGFAQVQNKPSLAARIAARLRLPVVVVLGLKDVFARPLRAGLTIAALALTVITLTFSIGMEATIDDMIDHPERWGDPFALSVYPDGTPAPDLEQALAEHPDVAAYTTRLPVEARLEGQSTTVETFAIGGDVASFGDAVAEGRLFAAPGEAVAGHEVLAQLGIGIGDTLRLWIEGKPLDLRIVGRYVDLDHDGQAVLYSLDTYRAQIDPTADPGEYAIRVEPGANVRALFDELSRATGGRYPMTLADLGADDGMMQVRAILVGLNIVLLTIGVVNLLTTTLLSVRERFRDLGVLKTVGVTPNQVVTSVLTGVSALAVLAVVTGVPLGLLVTRLLFDELGRRVGLGPGLGTMPDWRSLAPLLPASILIAALGGIVPARRAAALRVTEALRYE